MGCRRVAPQAELVRVVRRPEGTLAVGRRLPGRGAWLCRSSAGCLEAALQRGAFARALRAPVSAADVESVRAQVLGPVAGPPTNEEHDLGRARMESQRRKG